MDLPDEMLSLVLSNLEEEDLSSCELACKRLRAVANDTAYVDLFKRHFPFFPRPEAKDAKKEFRKNKIEQIEYSYPKRLIELFGGAEKVYALPEVREKVDMRDMSIKKSFTNLSPLLTHPIMRGRDKRALPYIVFRTPSTPSVLFYTQFPGLWRFAADGSQFDISFHAEEALRTCPVDLEQVKRSVAAHVKA